MMIQLTIDTDRLATWGTEGETLAAFVERAVVNLRTGGISAEGAPLWTETGANVGWCNTAATA
jgi:hypothetical protein